MKKWAILLAICAATHSYGTIYYVSKTGSDSNPGSSASPWLTIQKAADVMTAGDTVRVRSGVYREWVIPPRGGASGSPITYEADAGALVYIRGSEVWTPSWTTNGNIVSGAIDTNLFMNHYHSNVESENNQVIYNTWNPYKRTASVLIDGIKYTMSIGLVFVNDRYLRQLPTTFDLTEPGTWKTDRNNIFIYPPDGVNIQTSKVEIAARQRVFAPDTFGLGYINVRGVVIEHAANEPSWIGGYHCQHGAIGPRAGHHWVVENNIMRYNNSYGMDCGSETSNDNPRDEGFHIIRNNWFHRNGQCGLYGMGHTGTQVLGNLVEFNNLRPYPESNWEHAGIKFHWWYDGLMEGNVIRYNQSFGLWLDWHVCGNRVTRNVIAHNNFYGQNQGHRQVWLEFGPGPYTLDNNVIIASKPYHQALYGDGAEDVSLHHNFILGKVYTSTDPRSWKHDGSCDNYRIYNNMFYDGDLTINAGDGHLSDYNQRAFLRQLKTVDTPEANSLYGPVSNYYFNADDPNLQFDPGSTPSDVGCSTVSGITKDFYNNTITSPVLPGPFQNLQEAGNDFDLWPIIGVTFNPALLPPEGNHPPVVDAGDDQSVPLSYDAWLDGSVRDDPAGEDSVTISWTRISGPASATIVSPARADTAVTFTEEGTYVVRLTGHDGTVGVTDEVTVTVGPVPTAPIAFDGFEEYSPGDLTGLNGGWGWSNAWNSTNIYSVESLASPMVYSNAAGTIRVTGGSRALRLTGGSVNTKVTSRTITNMTGDVYFSFLAARTNGALANVERICVGAEGASSSESGALFGRPSGISLGGAANYTKLSVISGTDVVLGQAYFVVGKMTWDPVGERFVRTDCWINPTDPLTPQAEFHAYNDTNTYYAQDGFNTLYIFGKYLDAGEDSFLVDEIRIGQSWRSVVPSSAPAGGIEVSTSALNVPEGGNNTFQVKLTAEPASATTVTVNRTSGDPDITVSGGASLVYHAGNWSSWQTVTLSAAHDLDEANGEATIQCSAPGKPNAYVTATETDDDDFTAPTITSVSASDETTVVVVFDEPVDETTAETAGHYVITNGNAVSGAVLAPDEVTVTLTVAEMTTGEYTLVVNNVEDVSGNPIESDFTTNFVCAGSAELIAYDGFDYADGSLLEGANGGTGWADAWDDYFNNRTTITDPGLTYSNLIVSGRNVFMDRNALNTQRTGRRISTNGLEGLFTENGKFGKDHTTIWLSMMHWHYADANQSGNDGWWLKTNDVHNVAPVARFGRSGNGYHGIRAPDNASSSNAPTDRTDLRNFYVVRIDFLPGDENIYFWLNPDPHQSEPSTSTADAEWQGYPAFEFDRIGFYTQLGSGTTRVDEVRVGATWTAVTPTPHTGDPADTDGDGMPDEYEERYSAGPTNLTATADDDGDGLSNYEEYIANCCPTNGDSVLCIEGVEQGIAGDRFIIRWQSQSNRLYGLSWLTNLFTDTGTPVVSGLPATPPQNVYTDATHGAEAQGYYRVNVTMP